MKPRQYFHLFRILEDYAKDYISFEDSPRFILPKDYPLTVKEVRDVLFQNGMLIQAMYRRDEDTILTLLENDLPPFDNYTYAQLSKDDALHIGLDPAQMAYGTPLPVQARYVLLSWNALRTANEKEMKDLLRLLQSPAFTNSLYVSLTKMVLSVGSSSFASAAVAVEKLLHRDDLYEVYYKLLSYVFRIEKKSDLSSLCTTIAQLYHTHQAVAENNTNEVREYLSQVM